MPQPARRARAKAVLAVAAGSSYTAAATAAGWRSGDTVSHLVARFNREGLAALAWRHGGGPVPTYTQAERQRILAEVRRLPDRDLDRTATWSLMTLRRALRQAKGGLPQVSTFTIWSVLREAGWSGPRSRTWCETGRVKRKRKRGIVEVHDPDATPKKSSLRPPTRKGNSSGWPCGGKMRQDHSRPCPLLAGSWRPEEHPARQPQHYVRQGTAKLLTVFHPATGKVRVKGVRRSTKAILHPWLQEELLAILATLPKAVVVSPL